MRRPTAMLGLVTTLFLLVVTPVGRGASAPTADGTYLRSAGSGQVYVIAGGAPLPVSSCSTLGQACQSATAVTQAAIADLRRLHPYPRDGTFLRSVDSTSIYRVAGGAPLLITSFSSLRGWRHFINVTQSTITGLPASPRDGTLLRAAETGALFRTDGGWARTAGKCRSLLNGCRGAVLLPRSTIERIRPFDGTYVRSAGSGQVYVIAGGAPLPVSSCSTLGQACQSATAVTQAAIADLRRLHPYPRDGTFLRSVDSTSIYRVAGGAPLLITSFSSLRGWRHFINVTQSTITGLPASPRDGTLLRAVETGALRRMEGGAPIQAGNCAAPADGCGRAVSVPSSTIVQLALLTPPPATGGTAQPAAKTLLLLAFALASALSYIVVIRSPRTGRRRRLDATRRGRGAAVSDERAPLRDHGFLAPVLLGVAAFVPTAYALVASSSRSGLTGSDSAVLSRPLLALYVLGLVLLALRPVSTRPLPLEDCLLAALLVGYWLVGALADFSEGYSEARLSFLLVPVIVGAAVAVKPGYEQALALLAWATIIVSAGSLILAVLDPHVAYMSDMPTRIISPIFKDQLAGLLSHPNELGFYSGLGIVLAVEIKHRWRHLSFLVCGLALVASESRTAWAATIAATSLLLAHTAAARRGNSNLTLRYLAYGGVTGLALVLGVFAYAMTGGSHARSLDNRTLVWRYVAHHWSQSPLIGHGPSFWHAMIASSSLPQWVGQAHNQFLETLMTTGLLGVLLLIGVLIVWTKKAVSAARLGYWMPLAVEVFILCFGVLENPIAPWGANPELWLLSIVFFLTPVRQKQDDPVSSGTDVRPHEENLPPGHRAPSKVTAILTSHNRRAKTVACLRSYFAQRVPDRVVLDAVLVDDGSCDGTTDAVRALGSATTIVPGTGDLYWSHGMALAEEHALSRGCDYLLWLNDDVVLDEDSVNRLLELAEARGNTSIVVGAVRDPGSGEITYSGVNQHRFHPLRFDRVVPGLEPVAVDTFDGNVVLVPITVASGVGSIDGHFAHAAADYDYGNRARRAGFTILLAPETIGTCVRDSAYAPWLNPSLPLGERTRLLFGRKGVPPRARARYLRRHGGLLWPVYWLAPYGRFLLSLLHPTPGWTKR